ncbi:unnamed protein product [Gadus morhua 'NCC']
MAASPQTTRLTKSPSFRACLSAQRREHRGAQSVLGPGPNGRAHTLQPCGRATSEVLQTTKAPTAVPRLAPRRGPSAWEEAEAEGEVLAGVGGGMVLTVAKRLAQHIVGFYSGQVAPVCETFEGLPSGGLGSQRTRPVLRSSQQGWQTEQRPRAGRGIAPGDVDGGGLRVLERDVGADGGVGVF